MKRKLKARLIAAGAAGVLVIGSILVPASAQAYENPIACGIQDSYSHGNMFHQEVSFRAGQFCLTRGNFKAVFQGDGNFVLYKGGRAIWNSGSSSGSSKTLDFQGDGNIVIYNLPPWMPQTWWSTGSANNYGVLKLVMQADGNLVLYKIVLNRNEGALWSSGTAGA